MPPSMAVASSSRIAQAALASSAHHARNMSAASSSAHSAQSLDVDGSSIGVGEPGQSSLDEFVLALHDFTPTEGHATCLTFKAGQVIRVLNRDGSGWWDGELDGRRGWFPSNYTGSTLPHIADEPLPPRSKTPGHQSTSSVSSWNSVATSKSIYSINPSQFSVYNALDQVLTDARDAPPVLQPLLQGISLLKSAVLAQRSSHFQPSTAHLISCVRNVLIRADCLQRETPTLLANPQLTAERKRILDDLSALVAQTRACSVSPESDDDDDDLDDETKAQQYAKMLTHALHVYLDLETFVEVALKCGVEFPTHRSSASPTYSSADEDEDPPAVVPSTAPAQLQLHSRNHSQAQSLSGVVRKPSAVHVGAPDGAKPLLQQRSPTLPSDDDLSESSATPLMKQKARRGIPGPSTRFAGSTPGRYRAGTGSSQHSRASTQGATVSLHVPKASTSSISSGSSAGTYSSGSHNSSNPPSPHSPPPRAAIPIVPSGPCTPADVLGYLRILHDDLLDCVSKFVGKVHAHVPGDGNGSWKGEMVAATSAVVMKVASLVGIVDAVVTAGASTTRLRETKEHMYVVANALVDAIKQLVARLEGAAPITLDSETAEQHKRQALQWATGTLKAASECETALRLAILRNLSQDAKIVIAGGSPDGGSAASPSEDVTVMRKARSLASIQAEEADVTVHPDVTVRVTPSNSNDAYEIPARRSEDNGSITVDSMHSSRSRSGSSAMDSMFSTRMDNDSLLSDIEETQATEEDEPLSKPEPDARAQLTRLDIPSHDLSMEQAQQEPMSAASTRSALEEKILRGDLPQIPITPLPSFASISSVSSSVSISSTRSESTTPANDPSSAAGGVEQAAAPSDVIYNAEGLLMAASLDAIVERMTPHAHIVDPIFATVFFSTFRMFTAPGELVDALRKRFNLVAPVDESDEEAYDQWRISMLTPVRLRVVTLLKSWLEFQWRSSDRAALEPLSRMLEEDLVPALGRAISRIAELIAMRSAGRPLPTEIGLTEQELPVTPTLLLIGQHSPSAAVPVGEIPRPIVNKSLFAALKERKYSNVSATDFDPLELARQLTIMENEIFRAVRPEEVLESDPTLGHVRQLSTLSTAMTTWVVECVLNETDTKKRTAVVKFFIRVGDRCMSINNLSAPRAILAALDSSTISRLHQTWQGLDKKTRALLDELRKLADPARNYSEYRNRLKAATAPALPFLGLYLTDTIFCREGNPSHRSPPGDPSRKLINFNKYHKMTRIVTDLQRFQKPYALKSIPEIQAYLAVVLHDAQNSGDLSELYRRSLLVEPRQAAETAPQTDLKQLFGWAGSLRGQSAATAAAAAS